MSMISRQWRGLAHADQSQNYVKHLQTETFPALRKLPGFIGASILSRSVNLGIEIVVITQWESLDCIIKFAGADAEAAVVPGAVAAMMVEYDLRAKHFDVVE
jgi:heme-degrading monooxygenase HmoA